MAGTENGISFIVRIHNEEKTLNQCVRSLDGISIPHEIVLVLHRCTDGSSDIAMNLALANPHVRVVAYDHAVSRAGYETLATDTKSPHSFIAYSTWCSQQAGYPWVFRWDADFVMTNTLRDLINTMEWNPRNARISIVAKNSSSENRENYLCCGLKGYGKHIFWETAMFPEGSEQVHFPGDALIEHASELSELKTYWNEPPWFESEDSEYARTVKGRIERLTAEFGPEPRGMARASNPECDKIFKSIAGSYPAYVDFFS
jgi:glycosyltransferase involved in cell wall biosynthesis